MDEDRVHDPVLGSDMIVQTGDMGLSRPLLKHGVAHV